MIKILSIDGGGLRGIIPALYLEELEKQIGKPLYRVFDVIIGTSTGSIISAGICTPKKYLSGGGYLNRYDMSDIVSLYQTEAKEIFKRPISYKLSSMFGLSDSKYDGKNLRAVLSKYFSENTIGDMLSNFACVSYDIENNREIIFSKISEKYKGTKIVDCVYASSAAPTYFDPIHLSNMTLVDGGVYANNPSVIGFFEAKKHYRNENLLNNAMFVSLGTGISEKPISYEVSKNWGTVSWLSPILKILMNSSSNVASYTMENLVNFKEEQWNRFQISLNPKYSEMDKPNNIPYLYDVAKENIEKDAERIKRVSQILKQNSI